MTKLSLPKSVALLLIAAATGLVVYACKPPLTPDDVRLVPKTLVAVSPTAITATVGSTIQNQPVVQVNDQYNEGLGNVSVAFSSSSGSQPQPSTVVTNSNGQASPATWTLSTTSGTVTLTASVPGQSVASRQFVVTLNPGPATQVAVAPGTPSSNNQTATAGSAVTVPPQVKVSDQYGNGVPSVPVTFAVTGGGGVVVPTTAVNTDASGIARVTSWTLGTTAGANTLRATATGIATPVTFTATGVAGPAASIVIAPGSPTSQNQTAVAGTTVPVAPAVLVRDANSNIVSGVGVRFTVATGAGKVLASSTDATGSNSLDVTTNSSGIATVYGWRLGALGTNTLSVTIPTVTTVPTFTITATATAGAAASIAVSTGAFAYTRASTNHLRAPSVIVKDAGGNNVSGATVTWSSPNANSTVSGTITSTTASTGIATFPGIWTAGATAGLTMTLTASVQGTALSTNLTSLIVGAPASITISAGNGQSAPVNTAVGVDPAVLVRDASLNPVPGQSVSFAVTAGGGFVTGTPVSTDSVGRATVGSWTLGSTAGTSNNSLTATVTGTALTVTFTASATSTSASCTTRVTYTLGTIVNGSAATTDCAQGSPIYYQDIFQFTPISQTYFSMTVASGTTGTKLVEWFWPGSTAGSLSGYGFSSAAGVTDTVYNIVAGGVTYPFDVRGDPAGSTGTYTLSSAVNPSAPANQCAFFVTKNVTFTGSLDASNCLYKSDNSQTATNRSSRVYYVNVAPNTSLTVRMSGTLDNYIEVYDVTGTRTFVNFADSFFANSASPEVLTISAATTLKFYEIRATHYLSSSTDTPKTGTFTLTIDP